VTLWTVVLAELYLCRIQLSTPVTPTTAYAAFCSAATPRSQAAICFQLAKFRLTTLSLTKTAILGGLEQLPYGIYGVIAYAVAHRTREIRIRMALGAQIADVQNMFLRQGLWLTATGILIGIGVAMVVTRVMSAFLFGVGPMDPVTYATVSGTLAVAALVGTYLPARGATRVDPLTALRAE
jgi:putative ABC transport system permease protein